MTAEQGAAVEESCTAKTAVVVAGKCVVGTQDRLIRWFLLPCISVRWILRRLVCGFCGKGRPGRGISYLVVCETS